MQHAGNGAVVDRLIGVHRLGVVVLDDLIDISELFQAVTDVGVSSERCLLSRVLGEKNAQAAAGEKKKNYQER